MREKRAEWIRQSRWLWIRLVWQGKEWRKYGDIMALEFNRVALDVTGERSLIRDKS
ncbi:hypothetical protein HanRHA438_Chr06g0264551 [Helianthus annuus]|nr:hypothetical protein HanIR_Chr06g0274731 [Helianthus annuus]KAJ0911565.1 hypothetical protein HanRHA438_Chr06g0264551 [Helianthus annuus]